MQNSKYSPEEILQILNDSYHCQMAFDPEVYPGADLTFATTISEWRELCDLLKYKTLAKVEHEIFNLTTPLSELEAILFTDTTLLEFCRYISEHAVKQKVSPIIHMGQSCMKAAIFKTLIANLQACGIDTRQIKPSSKMEPLFMKHGGAFITEVSKLAPGALSKFEYEDNWISKTGSAFFLLFFFSIIIVPVIWHFHWILFAPLFTGIALMIVGSKFSPAKLVTGGYDTVRELIVGMQARM